MELNTFLNVFWGTLLYPLIIALVIFSIYLVGLYYEAERWLGLFLFITFLCLGIALMGEARHNLDWAFNRVGVILGLKSFPMLPTSWQQPYDALWPWMMIASALVLGAGLFLWERTRGDYLPESLIAIGSICTIACFLFLWAVLIAIPPDFAHAGAFDFGPGCSWPDPAYWWSYIYTNGFMALLGCALTAISVWRLSDIVEVD